MKSAREMSIQFKRVLMRFPRKKFKLLEECFWWRYCDEIELKSCQIRRNRFIDDLKEKKGRNEEVKLQICYETSSINWRYRRRPEATLQEIDFHKFHKKKKTLQHRKISISIETFSPLSCPLFTAINTFQYQSINHRPKRKRNGIKIYCRSGGAKRNGDRQQLISLFFCYVASLELHHMAMRCCFLLDN